MSELQPNPDIKEPKKRIIDLLHMYVAGDSHEHTVFSNPKTRYEADYTFEQVFNYINEEINEGETAMQFVILAEHPSDAGNPEMVDGQTLLEHQNQIQVFMANQESQGKHLPRLISGVEADIMSTGGKVNLPDEILQQMDFVIASKHGGLGEPNAGELESMYLGLMSNPNIDVIGHPNRYVQGDILGSMHWDELFSKARETNTAIEININAPMPDWLIKKAVGLGVPLFIGTDAHNLEQYQNLPNEVRENIDQDKRLNYPLGVKYSFWKKMIRVLRSLEAAKCPPEQIITSSYERLIKWLTEEKSERKI